MHKLTSILNSKQISFLSSIDIPIEDKDYSTDEVSDIYFTVMDKLRENLGEEIKAPDEFSKSCSDILSTFGNIINS